MPRFDTLILLILALSFTARSQQATVQGVVTDPSNAAVPDVKVTVTNTATGVALSARTNAQGFYSIRGLVPGSYRVDANVAGFAPEFVRVGERGSRA